MDFEFSDSQRALQLSARQFFRQECSSATVREVLEQPTPFHKDLWQGMIEMGFTECAIPCEFGGVGADYLELCLLAQEIGRSLAPVPFASNIYLFANLLLSSTSKTIKERILPRIATGKSIGCLAVAEGSGSITEKHIKLRAKAFKLYGRKLPVPDGMVADFAIVAAKGNDAGATIQPISLFLVDLKDPNIKRTPLAGLDPSRNQAIITFDGTDAQPLTFDNSHWAALQHSYNKAAVLTAFEQLGGSEACLDMAIEYALNRYAFGKPIASFQSIKHKLSDLYATLVLAKSNCYYGAWSLSQDNDELAIAAAVSRISASKAYYECAKENIQIHGGIGFTWELDCHLHYKRAKFLSLVLGGQTSWKNNLVDSILRSPEQARQRAV